MYNTQKTGFPAQNDDRGLTAPSPGWQLCWANRFDSAKDVSWHDHAEIELVAVTRGRCRINVGQQVLEGVPGSIFVLPARVAQYQETIGATRTTYLGFLAPPQVFNESARVLRLDSEDPAMTWVEQLCDGHRVSPPFSSESMALLLQALLRRIEDLDATNILKARLHPAVHAACVFMEANLQQALLLHDVALAAGISASHVSALFRAQFGVGPLRYLQRIRLERACWFLANPYLRIHEIANACGYDDVNYFSRLFRRRMGIAPQQWRVRASSGSA